MVNFELIEYVGDKVKIGRRGKKGSIVAEFHWRGHRTKSLNTTNLRVARRKAVLLAARLENGTYGRKKKRRHATTEKIELKAAAGRFIDFKRSSCSQPTIDKYEGVLKEFTKVMANQGRVFLDEVSLQDIDRFRSERREKVGVRQLHFDSSLVKSFFEWCTSRKLIAENTLASEVFAKPKAKRLDAVLTLDQVYRIVESAPPRIRLIVAFLAYTGTRSGECQRLKVNDVDFDCGWIHIRSRSDALTKTDREWRVPIHPHLRSLLQLKPQTDAGWFFTAGSSAKYPGGEHHFSTDRLNDAFLKILETLNFPAGRKNGGFTIHSLRHFFKSACLRYGVPREYVDAWQGHSSISRPSDLYAHVFEEDSPALLAKVPFGGPRTSSDSEKQGE